MQHEPWTVSEAKAHLSEILRRARNEGPQQIGQRDPCMVVPVSQWEALAVKEPRLGSWLVEQLRDVGEIELPSRSDPERPAPFADDDA
jgi:prevent-host-death family protein